MNCKRCGHALASNSALCPNCGMMMDSNQLLKRKEMNGANNPYIKRLEEIQKKNLLNRNDEKTNTNIVGYAVFVIVIFILMALIIGMAILKRI